LGAVDCMHDLLELAQDVSSCATRAVAAAAAHTARLPTAGIFESNVDRAARVSATAAANAALAACLSASSLLECVRKQPSPIQTTGEAWRLSNELLQLLEHHEKEVRREKVQTAVELAALRNALDDAGEEVSTLRDLITCLRASESSAATTVAALEQTLRETAAQLEAARRDAARERTRAKKAAAQYSMFVFAGGRGR